MSKTLLDWFSPDSDAKFDTISDHKNWKFAAIRRLPGGLVIGAEVPILRDRDNTAIARSGKYSLKISTDVKRAQIIVVLGSPVDDGNTEEESRELFYNIYWPSPGETALFAIIGAPNSIPLAL